MYRFHLLNAVAGALAGLYTWQFLATNQDYTGPLAITLPLGLALTFLAGPAVLVTIKALWARALASWSGQPFRDCLHSSAQASLPLGLLGLSPLIALLTGFHSTAYNIGVVVPVSLVFSAALALEVRAAWIIFQHSTRHPRLSGRAARSILLAVIVAFALLFSVLQVLRYNAYQLWGPDHSLATQALWNTCHGQFLAHTYYGIDDLSLLAEQFVAVYLLFVPIYCLLPNPSVLFVIQTVAVALAAWPVYHLARRRVDRPSLALAWALTYLLLPMTILAAQDSAGAIRPDTLAIPILICMLDALDRRAWWTFGVTVVLAFLSKQYFPLLVALLGLYIAIKQKRRILGFGLFIAGLVWFVALVQWIMPAIHGGPEITLALQYGPEAGGAGLVGMFQLLVTQPGQFLGRVFAPAHLGYLFLLLFTYAGLPLLDPLTLAPTLPILVIFGLALRSPYVQLNDIHYFPAVPFLLLAAINATARVRDWAARRPRFGREQVAVALTTFALGMSFAAGLFWSSPPWSWTFWNERLQPTYWKDVYSVDDHARLADQFVQMVPAEASVVASDYLEAHLANRPHIYLTHWLKSDVLQRVDYAVIDLLENRAAVRPGDLEEIRGVLDALLNGGDFALTAYEDGLLLFKRGSAGGYLNHAEVIGADEVEPQVRLDLDLGNRLRLIGYDPPAGLLRPNESMRVVYYWQVLDGFSTPYAIKLGVSPQTTEESRTGYVVADRFERGDEAFQSLHLPLYVQFPPEAWQPGQLIQETCEFRLPPMARGEYSWGIGLYVVPQYLGIRIRPDRQVPDTPPVSLGALRVGP